MTRSVSLKDGDLPAKIRKKADLLSFAKGRPSWILEQCRGIRFYTWWWMRDPANPSHTVKVDARAVSDVVLKHHFEIDHSHKDWRSTVWRFRTADEQ